jgi:hypothetical protein
LLEAVERCKIGAFEEGLWYLSHRGRVVLKCYKGHPPVSIQKALELEERMRHLIISYIGINFQAPDAFYSPAGFVGFSYYGMLAHVLLTAKLLAPKSL